MKKLITVAWSYTVSVDVPEGMDPQALVECDWNAPDDVQAIAAAAMKDASDNINWKDGVITDVQDDEDDEPLTKEQESELKAIVAEQNRRDKKNGLYGGEEDIAN